MSCRLFTPFAFPPLARFPLTLAPVPVPFPFSMPIYALWRMSLCVATCNWQLATYALHKLHTQLTEAQSSFQLGYDKPPPPCPTPAPSLTNSQLRLANGLQLCRLTNLKSHKVRGRWGAAWRMERPSSCSRRVKKWWRKGGWERALSKCC